MDEENARLPQRVEIDLDAIGEGTEGVGREAVEFHATPLATPRSSADWAAPMRVASSAEASAARSWSVADTPRT